MTNLKAVTAKLLIPAYLLCFSFSLSGQWVIQFREGDWTKLNSCSKCAECQGEASDKLETAKGLEFFCGDESLGKWFVIRIQLKDCGYEYYRTLNSNDYNSGQTSFRLMEDALADIYREVRERCPGNRQVREIRRMESPFSELSLSVIQNFYQDHDYFDEPDTEPFFYFLADMPRFPGCEEAESDLAKQRCAEKSLNRFFAENIEYPYNAQRKGIEGRATIEFTISKTGTVDDPRIVASLGDEIDAAMLRAVLLMNGKGVKWKPGMFKGEPIETVYRASVVFSLDK